VQVQVCATSGCAATPYCPVVMSRYFPADRVPPECPDHLSPDSRLSPAPLPDIFAEPEPTPAAPLPEPIAPEPGDSTPDGEIPAPPSPVPTDPFVKPNPEKEATPPSPPEIDTAPIVPGPGEWTVPPDNGAPAPVEPDGRVPEKIEKTLPPLPDEPPPSPSRMESFLNWLRSLFDW